MSLVLYGPPGTGKTTLAHVISLATKRQFVQLSALDSGVKEVRAVIQNAKRELTYAGRRTVLFIDEVHRFSKTQQDSLLSAVEDRIVSLIAATTENPFFSVVSPLLSRSLVLALQPLTDDDIRSVLHRAIASDRGAGRRGDADRGGGGAPGPDRGRRRPQGAHRAGVRGRGGGRRRHTEIDLATLETAVAQAAVRYDRQGDQHYDVASALIKWIRGSDVDAALHYLARMVEAGEDPRFIARRLVISASEDIGMADPTALLTAVAAADAVASSACPRATSRWRRPSSTSPRRRSPTRSPWPWASRSPTSAPDWAGRCPRACATPTTRGRRSSVTARPTTTRTPIPTASSPSSTRPTRWSARTTTGPPTAGWRAGWWSD